MTLHPFLHLVVAAEDLPEADAHAAMGIVLRGGATPVQLAAFLVALRMKGETPEELTGFARAMREAATPVRPKPDGPLIDTCGTGGDGASTFNISTVTAFVLAGAGVRVAKHGNRSISSHCGSADLMEALGVRVVLPPERMAAAIDEVGIGFLFAPAIHPAMKHAQPVRQELKMRTVFNLLGPLTNPAGATVQMVGAPSREAAEKMALALAALGLESGWVVHGSDGLDEVTLSGVTHGWRIAAGQARYEQLHPQDFGLSPAPLDAIRCKGKDEHVVAAREVLAGAGGPRRDIVLANAALALTAAGRARDLHDGVGLAAESLDSGAARRKAEDLAAFSQRD
ncbi:MAG: anthranilate phosphoribosyltransferase [Bryobacterales bacterium]|nr:anthranilate phosphoribosyltransferase [Bryobacterales bacterium]